MRELAGLLGERGSELRMAMAQACGGNAGTKIEVSFAAGIVNMTALTMRECEVEARVCRNDVVVDASLDGFGVANLTISVPMPLSVKISSNTE